MKVTRKERLKNLRKWVKALRSGKYRQTTGKLVETSGKKPAYCCLGVGCKVLELPKDTWVGSTDLDEVLDAQDMLGIDSVGKLPRGHGIEDAEDLVDLNDSKGYNFKQIANVIVKEFIRPLKKAIKNKKKVVATWEEE
jgi:hypothetical protein